jgi:hypothetical protein
MKSDIEFLHVIIDQGHFIVTHQTRLYQWQQNHTVSSHPFQYDVLGTTWAYKRYTKMESLWNGLFHNVPKARSLIDSALKSRIPDILPSSLASHFTQVYKTKALVSLIH